MSADKKLSGLGRSKAMAHYANQLDPIAPLDIPGTIEYILEHTGLRAKDLYALLGDPNDSGFRRMRTKRGVGKNMNRAYRTINTLLQLQAIVRDEILAEHSQSL